MTLIDVSDVVQYLYCPKKIYFLKVAGMRIERPKMEEGKAAQKDVRRSIARFAEKMGGKVLTNIYMVSNKYGLKGVLDALIETSGNLYPVDVKLSKFQSVSYPWKMQITAYAVLAEENFGKTVRSGFIYLIGMRKFLEVRVEPEDRKALKRIVDEIRKMVIEERYPKTSKSKKCGYCEVFEFCV